MDLEITSILSGSRSIRVVLYDTSPAEREDRLWVYPKVTYGDAEEVLSSKYPSAVVLEAHWGPIPYWTTANPQSPIGHTCLCLYAIIPDTRAYILAVVRTPLQDYPIPIYDTVPNLSMTLVEAAIASNPGLAGRIRSIFFEDRDISDVPSHDFITTHLSPTTQVLVTTLDKPLNFLIGSLYESFSPSSPSSSSSDGWIPPSLQVPFLQCKLLVQHAYALDLFPLQMIHVSKAILHVIISLARDMRRGFSGKGPIDIETADDDLADLLRATSAISRDLEGFLDTAYEILYKIRSGKCNQREVQRSIRSIFDALCGDFPGAVTVRCSAMHFEKLVGIDIRDL